MSKNPKILRTAYMDAPSFLLFFFPGGKALSRKNSEKTGKSHPSRSSTFDSVFHLNAGFDHKFKCNTSHIGYSDTVGKPKKCHCTGFSSQGRAKLRVFRRRNSTKKHAT